MSKRKTHEEFVKELSNINNSIDVIGKYINSNEKIDVKCNICGHFWSSLPFNLLRNHGCPMYAKKT